MDSETPVLEVLAAGAGMTIQDLGRSGWKRFGIPPGGAMDLESARQANLLVGNSAGAPVVELLFTGAKFLVLSSSELAIAGAEVECEWPTWRNFHVQPGSEISFGPLRAGVWSYLAVRGGFAAPRWFGSASANLRAGFGETVQPGARLSCEKRLLPRKRFLRALCRSWCGRNTDKLPSFGFGPVPSGTASPKKHGVNFWGKRGGYPPRVTGRDIASRVSPWSHGYECPARLSLWEQSRFLRMASLSCYSAMDRRLVVIRAWRSWMPRGYLDSPNALQERVFALRWPSKWTSTAILGRASLWPELARFYDGLALPTSPAARMRAVSEPCEPA